MKFRFFLSLIICITIFKNKIFTQDMDVQFSQGFYFVKSIYYHEHHFRNVSENKLIENIKKISNFLKTYITENESKFTSFESYFYNKKLKYFTDILDNKYNYTEIEFGLKSEYFNYVFRCGYEKNFKDEPNYFNRNLIETSGLITCLLDSYDTNYEVGLFLNFFNEDEHEDDYYVYKLSSDVIDLMIKNLNNSSITHDKEYELLMEMLFLAKKEEIFIFITIP